MKEANSIAGYEILSIFMVSCWCKLFICSVMLFFFLFFIVSYGL